MTFHLPEFDIQGIVHDGEVYIDINILDDILHKAHDGSPGFAKAAIIMGEIVDLCDIQLELEGLGND